MGDYDFILKNMRFSYSNINSFSTCKYGWFLNYIEHLDRISNCFADFGLICHRTLELFFKGKLEIYELAEYYKNNYYNFVTEPFPPFGNMANTYYQDGLDFFENFKFDKTKYDILQIEKEINTIYFGNKIIAKPDIVLKNKKNKNIILLDYKTSKLKGTKQDDKKLEEYRRQMEIYTHFIWQEDKIEINKIFLWFIRNKKIVELDVNPMKIIDSLNWLDEGIENIKKETEWLPNNTKENKFFCFNLCSMRNQCNYKEEIY